MNYAQLFADCEQKLADLGEEAEALKFVYRQLKGFSLTDLVMQLRQPVSPDDSTLIKDIFQQLAQHRPAQYIIGQADFAGLRLAVDERVLIPRPETEELVDLILSENSRADLRVLDLCTGSGAIALALQAKRPDWRVTASDISPAALSLAQENATALELPVTFVQSNLFEQLTGPFDIIVSNPPYISPADKDEVGANVLAWEPHLALFAEEDGLAIYRQIVAAAPAYLTSKGKMYFEIGYKQGPAVRTLLTEQFPDRRVRVLTDSFGRDRMVVLDDD